MTANPIGIIIVAIAALVAAFVIMWIKFKWFRDFWKGIWREVVSIFRGVWVAIKPIVGLMITGFKLEFAVIKAIVVAVWRAIKTETQLAWKVVVRLVKGAITDIKLAIAGVKAVVAVFSKIWSAVKGVTDKIWAGIKAVVVGYIDFIVGKIAWVWDKISRVGKWIGGLFSGGSSKSTGGRGTPAIGGRMAAGGSGTVTRPTLFLAGESGPEHYSFTPVGSGRGTVINLAINVSGAGSPAETAAAVQGAAPPLLVALARAVQAR
jgi:hypothetical protein